MGPGHGGRGTGDSPEDIGKGSQERPAGVLWLAKTPTSAGLGLAKRGELRGGSDNVTGVVSRFV